MTNPRHGILIGPNLVFAASVICTPSTTKKYYGIFVDKGTVLAVSGDPTFSPIIGQVSNKPLVMKRAGDCGRPPVIPQCSLSSVPYCPCTTPKTLVLSWSLNWSVYSHSPISDPHRPNPCSIVGPTSGSTSLRLKCVYSPASPVLCPGNSATTAFKLRVMWRSPAVNILSYSQRIYDGEPVIISRFYVERFYLWCSDWIPTDTDRPCVYGVMHTYNNPPAGSWFGVGRVDISPLCVEIANWMDGAIIDNYGTTSGIKALSAPSLSLPCTVVSCNPLLLHYKLLGNAYRIAAPFIACSASDSSGETVYQLDGDIYITD